jgi:hypothetical protein
MRIGYGDPTLSILPIFGLDDQGYPAEFLGTGFFTGRDPHLITCKHVLDLWPGKWGVLVPSQNNSCFQTDLIRKDVPSDLAILIVHGYSPDRGFPLFVGSDFPENFPVISLDYADSGKVGETIQVCMNIRHGGIIRRYRSFDRFGEAGSNALELSFPALRGQSGAPILMPNIFWVLGVIRDNVDHVLGQSHLEPTFSESGEKIDQGTYELPAAMAVHSIHLQNLLEEEGIEA